MNELERMTLIALVERNEFESAAFFKQCNVGKPFIRDQNDDELYIEVPMQLYKVFERFHRQVLIIEEVLRINLKKLGEHVTKFVWMGDRMAVSYNPVKKEITSRTTIVRYRRTCDIQFLKADYTDAVITARKAIEIVCYEIIAKEHTDRPVTRLPIAKLWLETKKIVWKELAGIVERESLSDLKRNIDQTVSIGAGIRSSNDAFATIKFKHASADARYIINNCFSAAFFLYDAILLNMENK